MGSRLGRLVLVVCGVGAVAFGAVSMVVPEVATLVTLVGGAESLLALLALLAFVQMARVVSAAREVPWRTATLPDAHRPDAVTTYGEAVDRVLELSSRRGRGGQRDRDRLRRHVRRVAVDLLAEVTGEPPETVEARLADGSWTDDPVAAALFTDDLDATWRDRGRSLLGRETTFQTRVRRAVVALERRVEGEADG